jgi:DNA adenine methylase
MPRRATADARAQVGEAPAPRPFLKWVGGKGLLLDQLRPLLPRKPFRHYFEPFVGSAALFFAVRPARATLSDVNGELVDCYRAVQKRVGAVIEELGRHEYDEEKYYAVRDIPPSDLSPAARAARTIYLNKTGYNGLYRVNKSGRFNVPFGRYTNPGFRSPDSLENLRACSRALKAAAIAQADFGEVARVARAGDFVYFDPPYVPLSDTSAFTAYAAGGFGPEEQARLAVVFSELARRGVLVMLSNSDTPEVRALYARYRIDTVQAARNINSRGTRRGKVNEVVVRSYAD